MNTKESFDKALKLSKGGKLDEYYASERVLPNRYYFYYTLDAWNRFLCQMSTKDKKAYGDGGGKELEERYNKGVWLPPKMAAFASSSRFVYDLLKGTDVVFEQKLPTSIPYATSNMDAFYLSKNIFIETKCHEIYVSPSPTYKKAYKVFYDLLASKTSFSYQPVEDKNDSAISFFLGSKLVEQFDIKQIIAHSLGIAYACKNGVKIDGEIKRLELEKGLSLIYMLYNPRDLKKWLTEDEWKDIRLKHDEEVNFINEHHSFFKALFGVSLEYVGYNPKQIDDLKDLFVFKLVDQFNYKEIIGLH